MGLWGIDDRQRAREASGVPLTEIEAAARQVEGPATQCGLPGLGLGAREGWSVLECRSILNAPTRNAAGIPGPASVLVWGSGRRARVLAGWYWTDGLDAASVAERLSERADTRRDAGAPAGSLGL